MNRKPPTSFRASIMMKSSKTQDFWIDTADGRIFARAWSFDGDRCAGKEPIILLHDSLGCVELWRDFPAALALATGRAVIAYDRLGFGGSDRHPDHLSPSFVRGEAHGAFSALRASLEIENFVAFGHSVGGAMAVAVASAFPTHCRALITESAQAFVEDRTLEGIRKAARDFEQQEQMERLRRYHGDKAEWVLRSWIETWLSEAFASWTLDEDLRNVRCPVLTVHGDNDEYGSIAHASQIASLAAGPATLKILPNCGHVPHRENRRLVLDSIGAFLERKPA